MLQQKKNPNLCATCTTFLDAPESLDFVGSLDFILVSESVDPSAEFQIRNIEAL